MCYFLFKSYWEGYPVCPSYLKSVSSIDLICKSRLNFAKSTIIKDIFTGGKCGTTYVTPPLAKPLRHLFSNVTLPPLSSDEFLDITSFYPQNGRHVYNLTEHELNFQRIPIRRFRLLKV